MSPTPAALAAVPAASDSNAAHDAPEILYRDAALLVVNKPSGLLSVPGRGEDKQDCLSRRLQATFADVLIVHRLDMHTSGVLVLARGKEMQRRLSKQFAERQVDKRYLAVVAGKLPAASGEIDLPLSADWPHRPRQKIDLLHGKPALTRYEVIRHDQASDRSRVALLPITGRTHQLRVHLLALGHPIIGDALYAGDHLAAQSLRLLLHAEWLAFTHPESAQRLQFFCPAPF